MQKSSIRPLKADNKDLEVSYGIGKPKKHDQTFEMPISGSKSSSPDWIQIR